MKKLLVAVDFSPASQYAYEYAEWLSLQLGGTLSAVYVNTATHAESTIPEEKRKEMIQKENEGYKERLHQFTVTIPTGMRRRLPR